MKILVSAVLLMVGMGLCAPVFAQEKAKSGQKMPFYMVEDQVKPSKYFEYLEAVEAFVQMLKDNKFEHPVHVFRDEEFKFYYSMPIGKSHAYIDSLYDDFGKLRTGNNEAYLKTMTKFNGTYDKMKEVILIWDEDLSYIVPNQPPYTEEHVYYEIMSWYIIPGQWDKAKELMKKWVKLYADHNMEVGFNTYIGGFGTEKPMMEFAYRYKNKLDAATQNAKADEILMKDEATMALWKETLLITQGVKNQSIWYLPKYSYTPEKK